MRTKLGRALVVLGMQAVFLASVATAEPPLTSPYHFEMLEGQGVEVCEACLKAFEAIAWGPDEVGLSGCERNYDSTYGLSAPQWTELQPLKHLPLLKQVMLFLIPPDPEAHIGHGRSSMYEGTIFESDETFRQNIEIELKNKRIGIAQSQADIDNDGHPEPLFTYRIDYCANPQAPAPTRVLFVLTPDRQSIDMTKTDLVTQNELKTEEDPGGDFSGRMYGVFFFKGQTYFDKYDRDPYPDIVTVYQAKGKRVSSLCKFRYE